MIHGIYVRTKPKNRWQLISTAVSSELALKDKELALEKAKKEGLDTIEVEIQSFETAYFIPQTIINIKSEKLLYN